MSTAKFRNMISNYNRFVPRKKDTSLFDRTNYIMLKARQSGQTRRNFVDLSPTPTEDIMVREMIDNIDFINLYRSIEFRKKLRERLDYYERKKISEI